MEAKLSEVHCAMPICDGFFQLDAGVQVLQEQQSPALLSCSVFCIAGYFAYASAPRFAEDCGATTSRVSSTLRFL